MANQDHLDILKQGVEAWNQWREEHAGIQPDLRRADLRGADLRGADLSYAELDNADLSRANLSRANLSYSYPIAANLSSANLSEANLSEAYLSFANLSETNLCDAYISDTELSYADLSRADLRRADFTRAALVGTNLTNAILKDCKIYGISAWDVQLDGAEQLNLTITPYDQPTITVDNLKIAQFLYLLLNNEEIRDVIDTIARKAVLILGRFTPERKAVLDALRETLRTQGYVPILFDFDRPSSRNVTETVRTLAHLSRFIIADLTDPSSIPYELAQVVPGLAVPVQPVLLTGKKAFSMFPDLSSTYHWVLPVHYYTDQAHLLATLKEQIIAPAEQKAQELEKR